MTPWERARVFENKLCPILRVATIQVATRLVVVVQGCADNAKGRTKGIVMDAGASSGLLRDINQHRDEC